MEDSCFNFQWPVNNSINDQSQLTSVAAVAEADAPLFGCHEPVARPSKLLKTENNDQSLMNQYLIHNHGGDSSNQNYYVFDNDGAKLLSTSNTTRVTSYQDHILAERKRRQKLSQSFIALSALLPNLKKMDKASVLGDAIEYMKTLQEKVKKLEEQTPKRSTIESIRFKMVTDDDEISESKQLPEIEARFSGKDVLIRVHCEKKPGVVENTLAEIEKLNLSVISSTAVIFANSMLHITVIAKMDKELTMTMKDFVKNLRLGLKQFM